MDVAGAPSARENSAAAWTGRELLVVGGNGGDILSDGARYVADTDRWEPLLDLPEGRSGAAAVWTGDEMIVWGGFIATGAGGGEPAATGVAYRLIDDAWRSLATVGAPTARYLPSAAIWTGTEMLVWGGAGLVDGTLVFLNDGALYDPAADSWRPTSDVGGPPPNYIATAALWTGDEMVVGGTWPSGDTVVPAWYRYSPASDSWREMSADGAPDTSVLLWTGDVVFGYGFGALPSASRGALYDPASDTWTEVDQECGPPGAFRPATAWTGSLAILWGGLGYTADGGAELDDGGIYDPEADAWIQMTKESAPSARHAAIAVWTGQDLLVWGGVTDSRVAPGGARYRPE